MKEIAPYIVVAWVVAMIGIFPFFRRPRRAVLFIVISGMLFLPEAVPNHVALGPLHFTKYHAISYAAFLGVLLFNPGRLFAFHVTVLDLPAIVWCLCTIPSILTNAPPPNGTSMLWDAFVQTSLQISSYGIPYLLGRLYFSDRESFRELGLGIVTGALVYAPLCLYEIRMSPQLHHMVYGYTQHSLAQVIRFEGFRPMVFFSHGLTLAIYMMSATMFACVMWLGGDFSQPKSGPLTRALWYSPGVLCAIFVLLKSTGALALGLVGGVAFITARLTNSGLPLLLLAMAPFTYVAVRTSGMWTGDSLSQWVAENISHDRAESLAFRFKNENMVVKKALEQPLCGWGGWGRSHTYDEQYGNDITIVDGLWIIVLGDRGLVGLLGLGGMLLFPIARFARLCSPSKYLRSASASAGAFTLALVTIDSLPNVGLAAPIYFLIAGGLTRLQLPPNVYPQQTGSTSVVPVLIPNKSLI